MPLVKNTITGNNYLVKINTDGDECSRTAIRSYDKQTGSNGVNGNTRFYLPFNYSPSSHTLWVFVNGNKAVVEQTAANAQQYEESDSNTVEFGTSLQDDDVLEFIVAGSYLNDEEVGGATGGGLQWILTNDTGITVNGDTGYMIDTVTQGARTFQLPASPAEGDTFAVADAFGNFGTNAVTLERLNTSHKIQHIQSDFVFDKDGMAAQFTFDGIDNWLIVNDSGFVSEDIGWTVVSTHTSAGVGGKYFVSTDSIPVTIIAPATPVANDEFVVSDYSGNFGTNNCLIDRNSSNIMGVADDFTINVSDVTLKFVFIDGTQGWRIVSVSS